MPRLSFQPLGDSWLFVALLLAALVVGLFVFRPNDATLSAFRRRVEFGVRLALVGVFALLFSRPSAIRIEKEELPASVVILCDVSESMSIRDENGGASRFETLRKTLENARTELKTLGEKFDVRVLGFGDSTEELEFSDGVVSLPDAPTGSETPLGSALEETLRETAGKRLLGVAVLSDGSQRTRAADAPSPQDVALRFRDAERPIFATPFGSTGIAPSARDVAVVETRANDRVYLGNELSVSGRVRLLGLAGSTVPLELSLETPTGEMEVVDRTTFAPEENDVVLPFKFACSPQTPGEWKLRVAAPIQRGETVETNNELGSFVEVVDGGLNVLYIEGTRRYEQNFLRAALDSASDVRVQYWRPSTAALTARLPNATEAERVEALARSRKSLVEPFFSPGKFSAYILGDVDAAAFQPNELKALAKLVEDGTGLVVLGGERSLGPGGYAETPLADVLPVQTRSSDRLPLDVDLATFDANASAGQRIRFDGEFRALPATTKDGRVDFVAQLSVDPKKNAEIWGKLPPLSDVYRLGRAKPGATTVLVAKGRAKSPDGSGTFGEPETRPLLVSHLYGAGRVATLATDSTWRWRMRGFEAEHRKFWRGLLLWAAKMDELLEGELAVELDRSRFAPGENVDFRVVYRPKPGENPTELKARAVVVAPDGSRVPVELVDENGVWAGAFRQTDAVGDYRIEAEILSTTGATLQSSRARFLTFAQNLELDRPASAPETLENLASTTNGAVVSPDEFRTFLTDLAKRRETIADFREVKRTLYDVWPVFALFVGLWAADWILRRRWNLI